MLFIGHFNWNTFCSNYGIWRKFSGSYIHCRDSNWEWKLDYNGYGLKCDCRDNWPTNGTKRYCLFDRDFS